MYHVVMQKTGHTNAFCQLMVSGESLHEAEQAALVFASEHFKGKRIVLVHVGNLMYDVFEVRHRVAKLHIKTEGD